MDIRQLSAFLAVAESGSATRAAEMLHIVQPAVSRNIRLLEEEIGQPLFNRQRHGMTLTNAGVILADHARRAIRELDEARARLVPGAGAVTGTVAVGFLPSTCDVLATGFIQRLATLHPDVSVRLSVGYAGYVQHWLESGEVDIALLYDMRPVPGLLLAPLLEEQLYLVGSAQAGLRLHEARTLKELASLSLILPSAPHGLRSLIERAGVAAGVDIRAKVETNAMTLQKSLVRQGFGYTVLPACAVSEELEAGLLTAAPLAGPGLTRRVVLARRLGGRFTPAAAAAADVLVCEMRRLVDSGRWSGAVWIG